MYFGQNKYGPKSWFLVKNNSWAGIRILDVKLVNGLDLY